MNDATKRAILRMSEEGANTVSIAEALGISVATVNRVKALMRAPRPKALCTADEEERLWQMHQDGFSVPEIADKLNRTIMSVESKMRKVLRQRMQTMGQASRRKWTPELEEELLNDYKAGMPQKKMSEKYHASIKTLDERLAKLRRRHNMTTRRHMGDYGDLPPLTDWPKHPGCQCGYCPAFEKARFDRREGIVGRCAALNRRVQRADFCIADEEPLQVSKCMVMFDGKLMQVSFGLNGG